MDSKVIFLLVEVEENKKAALIYEVTHTPDYVFVKDNEIIDIIFTPYEHKQIIKQNTKKLYNVIQGICCRRHR